jgi:hypothetical protein
MINNVTVKVYIVKIHMLNHLKLQSDMHQLKQQFDVHTNSPQVV